MTRAILAALVIALLLSVAPAPAHAGLYLPHVAAPRDWFTQADFDAALQAAGYTPAVVGMFTWCELHASSTATAIRYAACTLDTTPANAADTAGVLFWWDTAAGRMWWEVQP